MKCEKGVSSISINCDNGLPSQLFEDLYNYYNDTDLAYKAYLKTKTEMFRLSYGLTNQNTSLLLDSNNEPILVYQLNNNQYTTNKEYAVNSNQDNTKLDFNPNKPVYAIVRNKELISNQNANTVITFDGVNNQIIDTDLTQLIESYNKPSNIELGNVIKDTFESDELNSLLDKSKFNYTVTNSNTNQLYKLDNELGLVINEDYIKNNTVALYELSPVLIDYIRLNNSSQYKKIMEAIEGLSKYRSKKYVDVNIDNPSEVKQFLINLFNGDSKYDIFHTEQFSNKMNILLNLLESNVGLILNTDKSFISSLDDKNSIEVVTTEQINDDNTIQYSESFVNMNSNQTTIADDLTDKQRLIKEQFDKTQKRLSEKRKVHFKLFPKKMQQTLEKIADEKGEIEVYYDNEKKNFIKRRITFAQTEQFVKGKSKEEVQKMNDDSKSVRLRDLGTELHSISENVLT